MNEQAKFNQQPQKRKMTAEDVFEFQFRDWNPQLETREEYEQEIMPEFEKQLEIWLNQFDFPAEKES